MKLSPSQKFLLGLLTFWPLAYAAMFFLFILYAALQLSHGAAGANKIFDHFFTLVLVHVGTMIVSIGLRWFYVAHASENRRLNFEGRGDWKTSFLTNSLVTQPMYYLKHVLREDPREE